MIVYSVQQRTGLVGVYRVYTVHSINKTSVESVQLGKIFDPELSFVCPPLQGIGLSVVVGELE